MKSKSILKTALSVCVLASSMALLTACGADHTHIYSDIWSSDSQYHWHAALCNDTEEVKDKELHGDGVWSFDANKHWKECPTCDYKLTTETAHNYTNYVCECGKISDEVVARIGTENNFRYVEELNPDVFASLKDGETFSLLKDYSYAGTANYLMPIDANVVLDFNGHTLSTVKQGIDLAYNQANKVLTLKNGTLETNGNGVYIQNGGHLVVEKDFTIYGNKGGNNSGKAAVVVTEKDSQVDVKGTLKTDGDTFTLSGNGSAGLGGVVINVLDGAKILADEGIGTAVYMPNAKELNIHKATIIGSTGVYIKSGNTYIKGATIYGKGVKNNFEHNNNGANSTGSAIVVEACGYPGGDPTVNIISGEFSSVNNKSLEIIHYNGHSAAISTNMPSLDLTPTIVNA